MAANLDASQRAFALLESQTAGGGGAAGAELRRQPHAEGSPRHLSGERRTEAWAATPRDLVATVQHEVEKLSLRVSADAVVVAVPVWRRNSDG